MKHKQLRRAGLAFGLALLLFFGLGCLRLAKTAWYSRQGLAETRTLAWRQLSAVGLREYDAGREGLWYISTDSDPQLLWAGEAYIDTVRLNVRHQTPPQGVVLYWKTPGQADFSPRQSVYAVQTGEGEYTFDLGGVRVSELRIDPDSLGGVITRFDGVTLNPPRPWYQVFLPGWGGALLLVCGPLAVLAAAAQLRRALGRE